MSVTTMNRPKTIPEIENFVAKKIKEAIEATPKPKIDIPVKLVPVKPGGKTGFQDLKKVENFLGENINGFLRKQVYGVLIDVKKDFPEFKFNVSFTGDVHLGQNKLNVTVTALREGATSREFFESNGNVIYTVVKGDSFSEIVQDYKRKYKDKTNSEYLISFIVKENIRKYSKISRDYIEVGWVLLISTGILLEDKFSNVIKFMQTEMARNASDPRLIPIQKTMRKFYSEVNLDQKLLLFHQAGKMWGALVREKADWDYKNKEKFKEVFPKGTRFVIDFSAKKKYRNDIFGNIHYGYIGRFAGFSETHLLFGAHLAQLSSSRTFDPPEDQLSVKAGLKLFKSGGILSDSALVEAIRSLPISAAIIKM